MGALGLCLRSARWAGIAQGVHPRGLEIATVALELSGTEASRPYIEADRPDRPFDSGFRSDVATLGEGEHYPKTM